MSLLVVFTTSHFTTAERLWGKASFHDHLDRFSFLFQTDTTDLPAKATNTTSGSFPRKKRIPVTTQKLRIDSLSIVPGTFKIPNVDQAQFHIDPLLATIQWIKPPQADSVEVDYRVFPRPLNAVTQLFKYDSIRDFFATTPYTASRKQLGFQEAENNVFQFGNIQYNGSFGRGISFGNAQDAVVNSNLNLQLSGYLGDSVEIAAAITDNNIPIQPDGNTQQLNEFDRIWLRFSKKNWQLNLGDIDIRQQQYYLNFYKRLQGVSFEHTQNIGKNATNTTLVSGSVAKGKFTRNLFQGLEGNQGPYRLQGANNEFFFVILAGTERVFIDGELMQRGEDQDYVINYNTAEITFTPKRMITKDKRIQVEFEYADRNFLNANMYLNDELKLNKKLKLRFGAFSNADAKNSPINQTLDADQKQFLFNLGDSINKAFFPVSTLDTFRVGAIQYRKIDSIYAGGRDSIFVYDTSSVGQKFSLSFLNVGPGQGDYIPDFNGANGKVYKWVAPVNGVPQGSFAPVAFLVTPKLQQVFTVGADYTPDEKTGVSVDAATSRYDINTYSNLDKENDRGYALRVRGFRDWKAGKKEGQVLRTEADIEYVQENFRPIERLRPVEFTRDWGLNLVEAQAGEQLNMVGVEWKNGLKQKWRYQFNTYQRTDGFRGIRHTVAQESTDKNLYTRAFIQYTQSDGRFDGGKFFRPQLEVRKKLPSLKSYTIGAKYLLEDNQQRFKLNDTLTPLSFYFEEITFFVRSNESLDNRWGLQYFTRHDRVPVEKEMVQTDRSHNFNIHTELLKNPRHQFRMNATFRTLEVQRPLLTSSLPDQSLLGRAEYSVQEWSGLLTGNLLYELGSGQEQRRDFSYLEVPAGQGEFTWIDYNQDGIPQLNEFELAQFRDQRKYIRIFTPTNDFIKANYTTFNYAATLQPRALWGDRNENPFKNFFARFLFQSSLQVSKKELAQGISQFNPFNAAVADTNLITLQSILANTLAFNRFSTKWGMDLSRVINSNKAVLTYGFESRRLEDWSWKLRWSLKKEWLLDVTSRVGKNELNTPAFDNRNFSIRQWSTEPRISYTRRTDLRVSFSCRLDDKMNVIGQEETLTSISFISEFKYNVLQNSSLTGRVSYNRLNFNSKDPAASRGNTTVGFIMLDGLLPGNNLLWNADFTKRLNKNLEFNFQYEGRKPGEARTIHTGRASIRALF